MLKQSLLMLLDNSVLSQWSRNLHCELLCTIIQITIANTILCFYQPDGNHQLELFWTCSIKLSRNIQRLYHNVTINPMVEGNIRFCSSSFAFFSFFITFAFVMFLAEFVVLTENVASYIIFKECFYECLKNHTTWY